MPKLGSGEIQFHGCMLKPAVAICVCFHSPQCVPDRDHILAHLVKTGVDLEGDFSLTLDADGNEDVVMVFGNSQTLYQFKKLIDTLILMDTEGGSDKQNENG